VGARKYIGVNNFYCNVLCPFLEKELVDMSNPERLDRIFEFLEEMALSDDSYVRDSLITTILEPLRDEEKGWQNARKLMGKRTGKLMDMVEDGTILTYVNLVGVFLKRFPEFQSAYKKELVWGNGEELSANSLAGMVLSPYLREELPDMNNQERLDRIFGFIEEMIVSDDYSVRDVVYTSIVDEYGPHNKKELENARRFMRKRTREFSDKIIKEGE